MSKEFSNGSWIILKLSEPPMKLCKIRIQERNNLPRSAIFVLFLSSNGVRKIACKNGEEEKADIMGFPPVPVKETWPTQFSQKLGIYRKNKAKDKTQ